MPKELRIPTAKVYKPLEQPGLRYLAAHGGRGSSKSHYFAGRMVRDLVANPSRRFVCVREIQKSLKESAYRLIVDKIRDFGVQDYFRVLNDRIETGHGGLIIFQGMQDHSAESIKSLEGMSAWVEEAQTMSGKSLEMLLPTIRAPGSQIWFSWNPRLISDPVDKFLRGTKPPPNSAIVQVNYTENPWFPQELEQVREHDRQTKPDRYGHIWLGQYEPQAKNAIWNVANIDGGRVEEAPIMGRIVVSVDPAISNEEHSDEHGIVVLGLGEDGRGYVIDDVSMKGTPKQWAERAVAAFDRYEADSVIVERNQGGDMVRHTLKTVRASLPIDEVVATRGKHVRAEPISALYATNQISHVGTFPELEAQLCRMTSAGYDGEGSPDRVDALVWGFSKLFPSLVTKSKPRPNRPRTSVSWMG